MPSACLSFCSRKWTPLYIYIGPAQPEMLFGSHVSGLFPFRFKCFWCLNKREFLLAPLKPTQVSALGRWLCLDLNVTLLLGSVFFFHFKDLPTDRVKCALSKLDRTRTQMNVSLSAVWRSSNIWVTRGFLFLLVAVLFSQWMRSLTASAEWWSSKPMSPIFLEADCFR